jgi:hypothetical protein
MRACPYLLAAGYQIDVVGFVGMQNCRKALGESFRFEKRPALDLV